MATADTQSARVLRHAGVVRITHWINAGSFIAFVLSGTAILLAYPRLHWGETGSAETPAWIELPLPFVLDLGIRGPGRYLHFFTAWVFLINGLAYLVSGVMRRHFREAIVPASSDLRWQAIRQVIVNHLPRRTPSVASAMNHRASYNSLQRILYSIVVFLLLPFMFLSGLAMSPTVTSVLPWLVDAMGGQQSARTLHFFAATSLLVFFLVHLVMVIRIGFFRSCLSMITGYQSVARTPK